MKLIKNMFVAIAMYSKIPVPQINWDKDSMRYALCFFPLIGVIIGALMALWELAGRAAGLGTILMAAVFVLIPVLVSGGIHLDGLLDTADALSSWQTKERRLEILKDSHAGAFAIIVCCGYFLADFGIWTEYSTRAVWVLALGFALSRALNGYGICTFQNARGSGLAATFSDAADRSKCRRILIVEMALIIAGMIAIAPVPGILAAAAALVTCAACYRMAMKNFGGITGDIQGFFLQVCELVMAFAVMLGGRIWL